MSLIARITGLGGDERYLRDGKEVDDPKRATKFRSPVSAQQAINTYLASQPAVVQRNLAHDVVEAK